LPHRSGEPTVEKGEKTKKSNATVRSTLGGFTSNVSGRHAERYFKVERGDSLSARARAKNLGKLQRRKGWVYGGTHVPHSREKKGESKITSGSREVFPYYQRPVVFEGRKLAVGIWI